MTDMTAFIQTPDTAGVVPTYTAATAADQFTAAPNTKYMLHYKNGATTTGGALPFKVGNPTAVAPPASGLGAGFGDAVIAATGMLATTEKVHIIDSNVFRNTAGVIALAHQGTLTTVSVAIFRLPN